MNRWGLQQRDATYKKDKREELEIKNRTLEINSLVRLFSNKDTAKRRISKLEDK